MLITLFLDPLFALSHAVLTLIPVVTLPVSFADGLAFFGNMLGGLNKVLPIPTIVGIIIFKLNFMVFMWMSKHKTFWFLPGNWPIFN